MDLSPSRIDLLGRVLDGAALRHQVLANNIANVNTPGYLRRDVSFEGELAKAVQAGTATAKVQPQVVIDESAPARVDGNTVDIDLEMGQLTKNGLLYATATQILASRMATLRSAISGRS